MTAPKDTDLERWQADWQSLDERAPAEAIRAYVRRQDWLLRLWVASEALIVLLALPVLGFVALRTTDLIERIAMLLLAGITIGTVSLSWWNLRGVMRTSATTTAQFVAISLERLRRVRLAVLIGWGVLGAEVAVFVVWISHRLYGRGPEPAGSPAFAWGLLTAMTVSAVIVLIRVNRWVRRETGRFTDLQREIGEEGE